MGVYIAAQVIKLMIKKEINVSGANLLILGITFKENCPDVRNTKIVDVINCLVDYGIKVTIYDPWASPLEVMNEYKLETTKELPTKKFDAIVLGVSHDLFLNIDINLLKKDRSIVYDVKGILEGLSDAKL
jgi:UDP-N-acetyl-D-galactosamine dehydrogenase